MILSNTFNARKQFTMQYISKNTLFQLIFIILKYLRILRTATYKIYLANNEHMP